VAEKAIGRKGKRQKRPAVEKASGRKDKHQDRRNAQKREVYKVLHSECTAKNMKY
jgi:hypothetical protein